MKVLILHDFLAVKGGAEQVVVTLYEGLKAEHEVALVAGYINYELFPDLKNKKDVRVLTASTNILGWESIKMLWCFQHRTAFIEDYDVCIFSGIYSLAAALKNTPKRSIYYCHTPPRFVYDLRQYYRDQAAFWQRPMLALLRVFVKNRYERSLVLMEKVLSNSENVQKRLQNYLNQESEIVYPPIEVSEFKWLGVSDYFLSTARLETYKRVEQIVRAFKEMPDKKLVVASSGRLQDQLEEVASGCPNITFTGWVDKKELKKLVGNCIATIYIPVDEDFGMSPVESMAAGKPVIGVDEGGVRETIISGATGILVSPSSTIGELKEAIEWVASLGAQQMRLECEKRAALFSRSRFLDNFFGFLQK